MNYYSIGYWASVILCLCIVGFLTERNLKKDKQTKDKFIDQHDPFKSEYITYGDVVTWVVLSFVPFLNTFGVFMFIFVSIVIFLDKPIVK